MVDYLPGETVHVRRGGIANAFSYRLDYVFLEPEATGPYPAFFSRNRRNLFAVFDRDHGGVRGAGTGAVWAREAFAKSGLTGAYSLRLLAQPKVLGAGFNPVCFWMAFRADQLIAVIAEVNNTFGHRHCYLCALPDFTPIGPEHQMRARKIFHVSPFQKISGEYRFHYAIHPDRVAIRIDFRDGGEGLIATYRAPRVRLRNRHIIAVVLRRPWAPVRTTALIYWQALKLKLKGARYSAPPPPPKKDLT
ncbi:DUF1365 domain-containing protein [Rhodobacteraceae bacterium]|nr:DUF1365 domain-containing protein [Paracoccaceae bacterium]